MNDTSVLLDPVTQGEASLQSHHHPVVIIPVLQGF